jgi:hypothetical protein
VLSWGAPLKTEVAPAQVVLPGAVAGTPEEVPTMSDPTRPSAEGVDDDERSTPAGPGAAEVAGVAVSRLRAEVADMRLRLGDEVRTRRVVVVDEAGVGRVRITASKEGGSRIDLLDADGFERIGISGALERGALTITSRTDGEQPTRVEVFGLDPDDPDAAYVGVELIDSGTSVGGFVLYEGRPPHTWTAPR